jgi:hypothetical protein
MEFFLRAVLDKRVRNSVDAEVAGVRMLLGKMLCHSRAEAGFDLSVFDGEDATDATCYVVDHGYIKRLDKARVDDFRLDPFRL